MDPAPARTRGFATLALATLAVLSVVAAWSTYALLFVTNESTGFGSAPMPYRGIGAGENDFPPSVLV